MIKTQTIAYRNTVIDDKNYNALDLAKFICAVLVFMIHVKPFGSAPDGSIYSDLNFFIQQYAARVAVPFFFIASGFFLYRKTTLEKFSAGPTKKYAVRLFRLYIIWMLIYSPDTINQFFGKVVDGDYPLIYFIRDLIFKSCYQLWYLPALIFAVVLITFLLYKKCSPKSITVTAALFYFAGLFGQSWFGFIKPVEKLSPDLWKALQTFETVIYSTRNGIFFAFLFVAIGMCIAFYNVRITKKAAFAGFAISMTLLFAELYILEHFDFIKDYNMFLFLVPAAFFMFCLLREIRLKDSPVYGVLRKLSSLMFYMHYLVYIIVRKILAEFSADLTKSWIAFIFTLLATLAVSGLIIMLSEIPGLKRLKALYC